MRHLNIEESRRLHELGAFRERAFGVGDWYTVEGCDGASLPTKNFEYELQAQMAILLPTLDDVLEALENGVPLRTTVPFPH